MMPTFPDFYHSDQIGSVYRVNYAEISAAAEIFREQHGLLPASDDVRKNWLLLVDVQNTFCIPGFELFVGGSSGTSAMDDNRRLCEFIYTHIASISMITATLDSHTAAQIFHPIFLIDKAGNHPAPYTDIHLGDLLSGNWSFNPALAHQYGITAEYGQRMVIHYAKTLAEKGKYELTIWPYHAMLGGIGHALVSAVEEAVFFHSVARFSPAQFEIKGDKPFTENYSVIGPEVLNGPRGELLGSRNQKFIEQLKSVDRLIIAGQAKSHCVAWTISDLLEDIQAVDPSLSSRIYLLEDCTSPVVVPGVADHTAQADTAFARFAKAGMHIVRATDHSWLPIDS